MTRVKDRDKADGTRRWGLVFAMARTWKTGEAQTMQTLVTPVPQTY